jgi:hypothetical protein
MVVHIGSEQGQFRLGEHPPLPAPRAGGHSGRPAQAGSAAAKRKGMRVRGVVRRAQLAAVRAVWKYHFSIVAKRVTAPGTPVAKPQTDRRRGEGSRELPRVCRGVECECEAAVLPESLRLIASPRCAVLKSLGLAPSTKGRWTQGSAHFRRSSPPRHPRGWAGPGIFQKPLPRKPCG